MLVCQVVRKEGRTEKHGPFRLMWQYERAPNFRPHNSFFRNEHGRTGAAQLSLAYSNPYPGTLMRSRALCLGLVMSPIALTAACTDSTAPDASAPLTASSASQSALADQRVVAFDDARERILPSFSDRALAARMAGQMDDFSSAYLAGNRVRARRALSLLLEELARSPDTVHMASLGALRLAFLQADLSLSEAETSSTSPANIPTP